MLSRVLLAACLLLSSTNALALGLGPYVEGNWGFGSTSDVKTDSEHGSIDVTQLADWTTTDLGVGFSLDTNLARDSLFNYRLKLGYTHTWVAPENGREAFVGDGFSMDNIFGFGVARSDTLRFWLGPAVRLRGLFFEQLDGGWEFLSGFGPEVGLNLHTGDVASIALAAGYQYNYGWYFNGSAGGDSKLLLEHLIFVSLTVFFRTDGDTF